eukprot:2699188-Amphidinium_carterae.1
MGQRALETKQKQNKVLGRVPSNSIAVADICKAVLDSFCISHAHCHVLNFTSLLNLYECAQSIESDLGSVHNPTVDG